MGYKCGNCNVEFQNKREFVEHMLDVHNSPFIEGDFSDASDKILDERDKDGNTKQSNAKALKEKVKYARGL